MRSATRSGARSVSARPLGVAQLEQAIRGSAKLERAAGLKAFAFQPDSGAADLAFDERRPLNKVGNPVCRGDHIIASNLRGFS